jgi:hypothetical protein
MATDPNRARVVLYGGAGNADTWEWDGAWHQLAPATSPGARTDHAMAFDARLQRVVLFGGLTAGGGRNDLWQWDGDAWSQLPVADGELVPRARWSTSLNYDAARGRLVLFGGRGDGGVTGDTWEWDGAWRQWTPAPAPPARTGGSVLLRRGAWAHHAHGRQRQRRLPGSLDLRLGG